MLKLLESAGEVTELQTQVRYALHVGAIVVGHYVADFVYVTRGAQTVEDCKGFRTRLYRWKKKHLEAEYGVRILET